MTQTKPSAAAMRAAEAFLVWNGASEMPGYLQAQRLKLAEIIDKESGLAELLEAMQQIDLADIAYGDNAMAEIHRIARAAITKAKKEQKS